MSLGYRMFDNPTVWGMNRARSRGSTAGWYPTTATPGGDPLALAAVAGAVRLISETIGSFVMRVYTGDAEKRRPVPDADQAGLLQNGAVNYCTSIDMWSDIVTSIELWEHGLIYKGRDSRSKKPRELYAFPPEYVCIYVDENGNKIIEARTGSKVEDITNDVIHVKGWSPVVGVTGQSALTRHATMLNGQMALQEFRGRFFDNDATPNLLLSHPGSPGIDQRRELRDSWQGTHGGPNGAKTGFLWGGITAQQLSSTLEQSQVEQLLSLDVMDVARIFSIYPRELLIADPAARLPDAENVSHLFHSITLLSRMRRIERAVSGDREIFPDPSVYCSFDSANFTRGSVAVTAAMVHQLVQVGVMTPNEGRSELGLPSSTDPKADELQQTPVGGAPNAIAAYAERLEYLLNDARQLALTNGDHE